MTFAGLIGTGTGIGMLAMAPETLGIPGYITRIVVVTIGYAVFQFQAANSAAVMADVSPTSGASPRAHAVPLSIPGTHHRRIRHGRRVRIRTAAFDITAAAPEAVAAGRRATSAVASVLVASTLAIWAMTRSASVQLFELDTIISIVNCDRECYS